MRQSYKLILLILVVTTFAMMTTASASTPDRMTIQGRLVDDAGDPVGPGPLQFFVALFGTETGGMAHWDETIMIYVDENGLWSIDLGEYAPMNFMDFAGSEVWLEITVNDGVNPMEVMPRIKLVTKPYSYRVSTVDSASGGEITSTLNAPELELVLPGSVGDLEIFMNGSANPVVESMDDYGDGAKLVLNDENGVGTIYCEADGAGTGGWFCVYGDDSSVRYFQIDGNYNSTGDVSMIINGVVSNSSFHTSNTENSSVQLPSDAIDDWEIFDEPGATSNGEGYNIYLTGAGPLETITSQSIVVPDVGYVMVTSHVCVKAYHANGTNSTAVFGISDDGSTLASNQDVDFNIDDAAATGHYYFPTGYTALFSVPSAGTYTYYLMGDENSGNIAVSDIQFNLLFIPTAYGTIDPTKSDKYEIDNEHITRSGLTESEVAEISAESEAFNLARVEEELAQMRAEVEALKLKLGNSPDNNNSTQER